jgi:hypothetical protein
LIKAVQDIGDASGDPEVGQQGWWDVEDMSAGTISGLKKSDKDKAYVAELKVLE